ncbi:hypothetical protein M501DRAFT_1020606 [Patellaria atrata CBS 101060]|uniref:Uncharacterized protein n=1 Tax=Patellaria atrata CBS 101060 TaxID=1346257 RepID=A0A9P4VIZ7_9PEZI|nr:hypothetical protein M501DRAFT_1020606 [Patellaria atrata CBS 101060]
MADADLGWKPNGRPQSTIARNFSAALDDLFQLDGGLDSLSKNVHKKKQSVSIQKSELKDLEARLREAEERLKNATSIPNSPETRKNGQRQTAIKGTLSERGSVSQNNAIANPTTSRPSSSQESEEHQSDPPTVLSRTGSHYVLVERAKEEGTRS